MSATMIKVNGTSLEVVKSFNTMIGSNTVAVQVVKHNAVDVPIFQSAKDGKVKWTVVPQKVFGEFKGIKGNELKRQFHDLLMDCTLLNTGFSSLLTDGKLTITSLERSQQKNGKVTYVAKAVEKGTLKAPPAAKGEDDADKAAKELAEARELIAQLEAKNAALQAAVPAA